MSCQENKELSYKYFRVLVAQEYVTVNVMLFVRP